MRNKKQKANKYVWWILLNISLFIGLLSFQSQSNWVEQYYSRLFYPTFSYLPKILFAWLPFSVGDFFYLLLLVTCIWSVIRLIQLAWQRKWKPAGVGLLRLIAVTSTVYLYFHLSWGLNYYREPLAKQLQLQTDTISLDQHLMVLDKFIEHANAIRPAIVLDSLDRNTLAEELTLLMKNDQKFGNILSKSNLKVKAPMSSSLISFLTVTGYFNPFTHEVHVNQQVPIVSFAFTVVHELAHQMGVGFEDECNFISFEKLKNHENRAYQYAAYYEAINYLMRPLYFADQQLFNKYQNKLSFLIRQDIQKERLFWQAHHGILNQVSAYFYDHYLKHNNQPEGMARYSLMSRLVIASELKELIVN